MKNLFIHMYISCSDVTPFHSARQYVSTGFELTSLRCEASFCLIQRGFQLYMLFVYKHFLAAVMNCSSQELLEKKKASVLRVVCSEVGRLSMSICFVFKALYCLLCILSKLWPLQGRKKCQILVSTSIIIHCYSYGDRCSPIRNNAFVWLFRGVFGITDCCYNAAWCNFYVPYPIILLFWQASEGERIGYIDLGFHHVMPLVF